MRQIKGKFIAVDTIESSKILLLKDQALRGKRADDSEVNIVKFDTATEKILLNDQPAALLADVQAEAALRIASDESTLLAAQTYANQKIEDLVNAAPATLDTLKEIADALGNDANLSATLTASIAATQAEVDDVEQALATETAARTAADSELDLRVDALEEKEFVLEFNSATEFPETGVAERIYVAKDTDLIYRWGEVAVPGAFDFVVGTGGDFATLHEALESPLVMDGHKIKVLNGTYESDVQLSITKKVGIYGESKEGVIIQTSESGSAPVAMIVVSVDDVVLKGLTIKHRKTTNTSVETAIAVSNGAWPTYTYVSNFIIDDCRVEYCEFAVVIRGDGFKIANSELAYATGTVSNSNRAIGIYGSRGECFIHNNVFDNSTLNSSAFRTIYSSSTNSSSNEFCSGKLIVSNNTHLGPLQQFYLQDNVRGTAGDFDLFFLDNTTNETSLFAGVFLSTANQADLFGQVVLEGNSISNNHSSSTGTGKGLFAIDGVGSELSYRSAALPVHSANNTIAQPVFREDYSEATGSSGSIVGFKSAVFSPVTVSMDDLIPATPALPETPAAGGGSESQYLKLVPLDSLEAEVDAAEAAIAAEASARASANAALDARLDVLEADPVTKSYVDSNDASTLASAQSYTDGKVASLVNSAPAVLDTLNELAAALGDDPNFAATVAGQISDLDGRLDILEASSIEQTLVVAKNGNDGTADGTELKPFASVTAALNAITDASPTKRYVVRVAPGNYSETGIVLKANVFIVGDMQNAVRITAPVTMASDFSGSDDSRSGFSNVTLLSAVDMDWSTVTSAAGKLYFNKVAFVSTVRLYGHNNAIAQAQFADCQLFGKLTISGINVSVFHNNLCWSGIDLDQHPNGGMATILNAVGGTIGGELKLTTSVDDFNRRCSAFLKSCYSGQITIDGVKSYVDATNDSIPVAGAGLVNGGNLIRLNDDGLKKDLSNLSYPTAVNQPIIPANSNATNMGDWGKQWMWHFAYIHATTGTDMYLGTYPLAYGADSEGKSVYIMPDLAGLQENANGGDIVLVTAAVSGTGVQGKIKLSAREVDADSAKIVNLAAGSADTDAVNKAQLDSATSALDGRLDVLEAKVSHKFSVALSATDIANGYVDLPHLAESSSTVAGVGRVMIWEGESYDYSVSEVGGVTRLTFLNSLASGGVEALTEGDVLHVQYRA